MEILYQKFHQIASSRFVRWLAGASWAVTDKGVKKFPNSLFCLQYRNRKSERPDAASHTSGQKIVTLSDNNEELRLIIRNPHASHRRTSGKATAHDASTRVCKRAAAYSISFSRSSSRRHFSANIADHLALPIRKNNSNKADGKCRSPNAAKF